MGGIVRTLNLIVLGLLGSAAAVAAPPTGQYCVVVNGMAPNCRFVDETSCAQAAAKANGGCIDRHAVGGARSLEPKNAGYCMISHGDSKCLYFDAQACANAAQLEGGTCVTRPGLTSAVH
jgi:hypothetical protein